jgi:hypothetical protein
VRRTIRKVTWEDIEAPVSQANPELAKLLSDVRRDPGGSSELPPLFVMCYPYGSMIVKAGEFQSLSAPSSSATPDEVAYRQAFGERASQIPVSVVLNDRCVEVFVEVREAQSGRRRIVPMRVLFRGGVFGVFEVLDQLASGIVRRPPWSVSAGARSAHVLLPFTKDQNRAIQAAHERKLRLSPPEWQGLKYDSWPLLRELAHTHAPDWSVELLVVPFGWVSDGSRASVSLQNYLYRLGWDQSRYLRGVSMLEADLQRALAEFQDDWGIKLSHVDLCHLKQMVAISQGEAVAFAPTWHTLSSNGPFDVCQRVLSGSVAPDLPALAEPVYLGKSGDRGYYSVSLSTIPQPTPERPRGWLSNFLEPFHRLWQADAANSLLQDLTGTAGFSWELYGATTRDDPDLRVHSSGVLREVFCPNEAGRFHCDHAFFRACIRIERH